MRKGSHLTEENKQKISQTKTGRNLGLIPWNKGLTRDDPRVDRMYTSPERKEKQIKAFTGRNITWGDNISRGKKGKPCAIAGWNKGMPAWNRGLDKTDPRVAKCAQKALQRFQNPEWVKYFFERVGAPLNNSEKRLQDILDKHFPQEWEYVGQGDLVIGGKIPDFMNVNGRKQVIEMFGTYWHRGENPQKRINSFMHFGFATIVIWEHELKDEDAIVVKIKNFPSVETLHSAYLSSQTRG